MFFPKYLLALPFLFAVGVPEICAETKAPPSANVPAGKAPLILPESGLPTTWIQGVPVKSWEKDKVYVFEFWATWCGPCLSAIPHLEAIHQKITQEKIPAQIVGINIRDRYKPQQLKNFLARRNTPPTYAIAVAQKETESLWLKPLNVIGIPFSVAVKNGNAIWKGHPTRLSVDLIREMTRPDFVQKTPRSSQQIREETQKRIREIAALFESGETEKAEKALHDFLSDDSMPVGQKIFALETPCYRALAQKDFRKMNASLRRQAETLPESYRNQMRVVNFILTTDDVPQAERDLALAIECLQRADALAKNDSAQRSFIQTRLAEVYAMRGDSNRAKAARELAWKLTSENKRLEKLHQKLSGNADFSEALSLLNALAAGEKSVPADFLPAKSEGKKSDASESVSAPTIPSDTVEAAEILKELQSLEWVQGNCPQSLPKNRIVFIDFWIPPPPGPFNSVTMRRPAKWLDEKVKNYPGTATLVFSIENKPGRTREVLAFPRYSTPHPVAIISAEKATDAFFKLFGVKDLPASVAIRDGKIIWSGTAQDLPNWLTEEALKPDYDHARAEALRSEQQKDFSQTAKAVFAARKNSNARRFAEAREQIEALRPALDRHPILDMTAADILLAEAYDQKNFTAVGAACKAMLEKYPTRNDIAEYQMKILNSDPDLHAAALPVLIRAGRNILATGTPYESAYWEILSGYYEEAGEMQNAIYAAIMARETSPKFKDFKRASAPAEK